MQTIIHDAKLHRVLDSKPAADSGALESAPIATGDLDGLAFIVATGANTSGGTIAVRAEGRAKAGEGDWAEIPGALVEYTSDGTDDVLLLLEIRRPNGWGEIRAKVTRGEQNTEIDGVIAVAYKPQSRPVEQPDTVAAAEFVLGGYPAD